jgi:hypothetical protein
MGESATIYVALLQEGTEAWRPVSALSLGGNHFILLGPMPDDETWEYQPGDAVVAERRTFADAESGLVAVAYANRDGQQAD